MSNMQVSVPQSGAVAIGKREEESESVEETTLTEVTKDTDKEKMHQKTATFEGQETTSIVEDHRTQQTEASKSVMQQETTTIIGNKQESEDNHYKPQPEPVRPFEPLKPFEPLAPFEPPQSFQLATQIQKLNSSVDPDPILKEIEDIYSNALEQISSIGASSSGNNSSRDISSIALDPEPLEISIPSPLDHTLLLDSNNNSCWMPPEYIPVEALPPLDLNDLKPPPPQITVTEIGEGNVKESLKEIISDLDSFAEKEGMYHRQQLNKEILQKFADREEQDENAAPRKVSLEKIFTPADGEQIKPKTIRKMFASSAFYDKGFHPTVEDQVELAKRISSSLSDISNQSSKGLQMYVNRKKRSVKWVHEGEGRGVNGSDLSSNGQGPKNSLKLVMNPAGQIQDIHTLKKQGYTFEPLSPDVCQEIVRGLNSPKGKGAELFAKRRKRSEKWVVGETNGSRPPSTIPDIAHSPVPVTPTGIVPPPSYLPETQQRLAHKEKLDEIQEKFTRPRIKLVKSPWEAALETGSVDAAFQEEPVWPSKGNFVAPAVNSYEQALQSDNLASWTIPKTNGYNEQKTFAHNPAYNSQSINRIVENLQKSQDVYKPALPQGWSSGSVKKQNYSSSTLPRKQPNVYVPQESLYTPTYNAHPPTQTYDDAMLSAPLPGKKMMHNYNTAARGWGQTSDYYRPLTFDKHDYSDF